MSARPRLLFVSPRYLVPADEGGKIRTSNVLRGMHGGQFEITLAMPFPAQDPSRDNAELDRLCERLVAWVRPRADASRLSRAFQLVSALPFSVVADASREGSKFIRRECARTDVVVFDFVHAAVLAPPELPHASIVFTHNVEAEILERHAALAKNPLLREMWRSQAVKMRLFEGETLRRFHTVVAVSERDAETLRERYHLTRVRTISTSVDLDQFTFVSPAGEADAFNIVFVGAMDWHPNADAIAFFLDKIWPMIERAAPNAAVTIVGRNPPLDLVRRAPHNWSFTGYVPDVRPFVRKADICIVPIRIGGGTRMKIYEAMAMGCPLVSTRIGAEGLPLKPDTHFLAADTAPDFAAAVVRLAHDTNLRRRISRNARAFVEARFGAEKVAAEFEAICLEAYKASMHTAHAP